MMLLPEDNCCDVGWLRLSLVSCWPPPSSVDQSEASIVTWWPIRERRPPPIIKHHQTQRGDTTLRGFEAWVTEDRDDNLLIAEWWQHIKTSPRSPQRVWGWVMQTRYLEDRVVRGHLETGDNLVIGVMTQSIKTSSRVGCRSLITHWTGFVEDKVG